MFIYSPGMPLDWFYNWPTSFYNIVYYKLLPHLFLVCLFGLVYDSLFGGYSISVIYHLFLFSMMFKLLVYEVFYYLVRRGYPPPPPTPAFLKKNPIKVVISELLGKIH